MIHLHRVSACLLSATLFSILSSASSAADEQAKPPASGATSDEFTEGWRRTLPVSEPNEAGEVDHCTVWIEDGWLQADRRTAEGGLEWHVVLAKATGDDDSIEITAEPKFGMFRLYFTRPLMRRLQIAGN